MTVRRGHRRSGPPGATVPRCSPKPAGRSSSVEKGRNHLIDLYLPTISSPTIPTTRSSSSIDTFSDRTLSSSRRLSVPTRNRATAATPVRSTRSLRLSAAAVCTRTVRPRVPGGGLPPLVLARPPARGRRSRTGRSTTQSSSRSTRGSKRASASQGLGGANPFAAWRSGPYPMPPGAPMYGAALSAAAAERLGYHPYPAPTAANSIPDDGRPACNNCGFCAFFACPIHAKGDPVVMLQRALLSGKAELLARDLRLADPQGRSTV